MNALTQHTNAHTDTLRHQQTNKQKKLRLQNDNPKTFIHVYISISVSKKKREEKKSAHKKCADDRKRWSAVPKWYINDFEGCTGDGK